MNRLPAALRQEGVRLPAGEAGSVRDDTLAIREYRTDCRREGQRLLAWYRRSMLNRAFDEQNKVLVLAARTTPYLLPTLRRLITTAQLELEETAELPSLTSQWLQRRRSLVTYLNGLESLWIILNRYL